MFNKIDQNISYASSALLSITLTSEQAVTRFEQDWQNPSYTQITLDPTDINEVLTKYYTTSKPILFTRKMLWDVERLKAWDPKVYIPHVVNEAHSWNRITLENGDESFIRWSNQKQWKTGAYSKVIETVNLLNKEQKVIFLGLSKAVDEHGKTIVASDTQPLFHVEHGVGGSEDKPLNTWRIVHLTSNKDEELIKRFENFKDSKILPSYIEIYIKSILQADVTKREL